jgi:hypothetical protein
LPLLWIIKKQNDIFLSQKDKNVGLGDGGFFGRMFAGLRRNKKTGTPFYDIPVFFYMMPTI